MGHAARTTNGERPRELTQRRLNHGVVLTIDAHAKAIQQTREFLADLSVRMDRIQVDVNALTAEVSMMASRKSVAERVRWILTGR
jgi:prephenate dehydratase